jgi:NAD(P)-dependent dehydrogenase (short-subunit alcohol dehydrogenase family)
MLVNNAGVFPEAKDMKDIPLELWESTFAVNMRASFYTSQLYVKRAKPGGRIINIASIGGLEVWKGRIPYNVSKASLINLSRALARDLAPDFSVNCVCPGTITFPEDPPEMASDPMIKKIPMKRFATPHDLFEAVYFFGTSTGYITGQTLVVDGGYHDSR